MLSEQDAGKPAAAALQSYSSMQKHSPMANVSTGPGKDVAFNTSSAITLKTLQLPESEVQKMRQHMKRLSSVS